MPLGPLPQTEALEDNPLGTKAVENDQDFNQSSFDADVDKLSIYFSLSTFVAFPTLLYAMKVSFGDPFYLILYYNIEPYFTQRRYICPVCFV